MKKRDICRYAAIAVSTAACSGQGASAGGVPDAGDGAASPSPADDASSVGTGETSDSGSDSGTMGGPAPSPEGGATGGDAGGSGGEAGPTYPTLPAFGNETLHPDRISFYMVPDLEGPYTGNWSGVSATFAKLHQLMPDAWVRWDNETGHNTNNESQVGMYVSAAASAGVGMIVTASACPNYNNMWANQYVTGNSKAEANATILDIANGGFLGFANTLLTGNANVKLVETLNEPDGPGWFVTDPDNAGDFDTYMTNVYAAMNISAGNQASAAHLLGPAVAFEGKGNIWGDWMKRSELTNVSYHTYTDPARSGLHEVPGKNVYVTEYGFNTTPISPAALLGDLWNIEKSGLFSGTIKKVFYNQFMQNGGNPAAFSQNVESGQSHFAERGWFRGLAAWVALGSISTQAERDDAHPDYLATDDRKGGFGALLWNDSGSAETKQTRTVGNTSPMPGAALYVLHVIYNANSDSGTGDCHPVAAQTVVSATVSAGTISVTVNSLASEEAVYVTTQPCDALAN